jgi:hypothetical protein
MVDPDVLPVLCFDPTIFGRQGKPAAAPIAASQCRPFSQVQRKLLGKALSLLHHHDKQEWR